MVLEVIGADSIAAATKALAQEKQAGNFVSNAGNSLLGAMMGISADEFRHQMENNVIAPVQITRACLKLVLSQLRSRIANVGSIPGIFTTLSVTPRT